MKILYENRGAMNIVIGGGGAKFRVLHFIVHLSLFYAVRICQLNKVIFHRYRDVTFCPKKGGDGTFLKRVGIPIRRGMIGKWVGSDPLGNFDDIPQWD